MCVGAPGLVWEGVGATLLKPERECAELLVARPSGWPLCAGNVGVCRGIRVVHGGVRVVGACMRERVRCDVLVSPGVPCMLVRGWWGLSGRDEGNSTSPTG